MKLCVSTVSFVCRRILLFCLPVIVRMLVFSVKSITYSFILFIAYGRVLSSSVTLCIILRKFSLILYRESFIVVDFCLVVDSSSCFPSRLTFGLLLSLKYISIAVDFYLAMVWREVSGIISSYCFFHSFFFNFSSCIINFAVQIHFWSSAIFHLEN